MTYSPLRYPGGKGQMYNQIVNIFEMNKLQKITYVEPFVGGGGLALKLLLESNVNKIIINDLDISIYSFWLCVIEYSEEFIEMIMQIDITIEEWEKQKEIQKNKFDLDLDQKENILILGFSTFFLNRTNRSGIITAGPIGGKNQKGNYKLDCRYNKEKLINLINIISKNRKKIELFNMDGIDFIKKIKRRRNLFIFIDPPYYKKGSQLYYNSFTHEDHLRFSKIVKNHLLNNKWILTYDVCDEILGMYKECNYLENDLRYSLSKKEKKKEYLFYHNVNL